MKARIVICSLLTTVLLSITGCSEKNEPNVKVTPFSQDYLISKTIGLNDPPAQTLIPAEEVESMDYIDIIHYISEETGDLLGVSLVPTQMVFDNLGLNKALYSDYDPNNPIILISAEGTGVSVRRFVNEGNENNLILHSIKTPSGNGEWVEADETTLNFYSYSFEDDWYSLKFPANRSDKFRCLLLNIFSEKKYPNNHPLLPYSEVGRYWIFVQLPWTDKEEIFDDIPYLNE